MTSTRSGGFNENKGLGAWGAQSRGLIKRGLGHSYLRTFETREEEGAKQERNRKKQWLHS